MLKIKLEKFEGPLSLLLKLIEREKLDITEISLAKIADQYIQYIQNNDIKPAEMADFLVIAARLLFIKSKALLPFLLPEEEEEFDDLEQQLKMYKEFVEASELIRKMIGKKKFMFARDPNKSGRRLVLGGENIFSPPKNLSAKDLNLVFKELLERLKPAQKLEEDKIEDSISIEDKISHIQNMLLERIKIRFSRILERAGSKTEIIVSFLAILELMRQRQVVLNQDKMFGEIVIKKNQESGIMNQEVL